MPSKVSFAFGAMVVAASLRARAEADDGAASLADELDECVVRRRVFEPRASVRNAITATGGACELLALALQRGADLEATSTSQQQTPLHLAITRGNLACALVLLDAGAKPSAVDGERRERDRLEMPSRII